MCIPTSENVKQCRHVSLHYNLEFINLLFLEGTFINNYIINLRTNEYKILFSLVISVNI